MRLKNAVRLGHCFLNVYILMNLTLCDRVKTTNRKILKIGESTHFYPRNIMMFDFYYWRKKH